jgi:hypothetical protein
LQRLVTHNIKINLQKCVFGSKEVSYLGFHLTEEGIKPGIDKLKAVKNAPPPQTCMKFDNFSDCVIFSVVTSAILHIDIDPHCAH